MKYRDYKTDKEKVWIASQILSEKQVNYDFSAFTKAELKKVLSLINQYNEELKLARISVESNFKKISEKSYGDQINYVWNLVEMIRIVIKDKNNSKYILKLI